MPWNKGKVLSAEHRKNLSIAHTGLPGNNKNRVFSEEWRENIRKAKLGNHNKPRRIFKCSQCGKEYTTLPNQNRSKNRKYCSKECFANSKKGLMPFKVRRKEECWNWQGGNSRWYKEGFWTQEYKNWRRSVFVRDEFTCQNCNKKQIYITAHHIKSWAHFPELRFDINNGITLCEDCHKKTDNYKGKNKRRNRWQTHYGQ